MDMMVVKYYISKYLILIDRTVSENEMLSWLISRGKPLGRAYTGFMSENPEL